MDYDDDVLHAACFLHNIETPARGAEAAAERVRVLLSEIDFDASNINSVCDAIQEHTPSEQLVGLEEKLLYDANPVDTIGAVGFARLPIGIFFRHHHNTMEEVLGFLRERLAHSERFCFKVSARMAKEKRGFMCSAVEQFETEQAL